MPLSSPSLRNFCSTDQRVLRRTPIEGSFGDEKDTIVLHCTRSFFQSCVFDGFVPLSFNADRMSVILVIIRCVERWILCVALFIKLEFYHNGCGVKMGLEIMFKMVIDRKRCYRILLIKSVFVKYLANIFLNYVFILFVYICE